MQNVTIYAEKFNTVFVGFIIILSIDFIVKWLETRIRKSRYMLKSLSRSTTVMFIYDLFVLLCSTILWYTVLNLPENLIELTVLLTVIAGLTTLFLKDNYKIREFNVTTKNGYLLFEGCVFSQIPAALLLFLFARSVNSLIFLTANLVTIYFALRLYRILFHIWLFKFKPTKNVLIVGANKNGRMIAQEIINKKALKMNVVGFIADTEDEYVPDSEIPIFNDIKFIDSTIQKYNVDVVIVAIKRRMEEHILNAMMIGIPRRVKVYDLADFYEIVTGRLYVDRLSLNRLFYIFMKRRSRVYDFCKRAYDIIAALIILTVTFPILLYIGLRVKLTDGGSAIYTQNRVGKGGKVFKAYKLRTMYKNDYVPKDGQIDERAADINDDRVIPFCKFVRKARFDEIPQMINILKGEMSIVGPRVEWDDLVNIYQQEVPYYACRQWVRTGWTGWAQINQGHCVSSDDIAEKLQYDLYYLKHRNVLWEIFILVKAVFLALGGRHG